MVWQSQFLLAAGNLILGKTKKNYQNIFLANDNAESLVKITWNFFKVFSAFL